MTANIMHICDSLFETKQDYCVLCLRTADSRRLGKSGTLTSVLELMDNAHVWPWRSRPKNDGIHNLLLCYICEARMATTHRMLQAIHFGIQFERLLHLRRERPTSADQLKTILGRILADEKGSMRHPLLHTAVSCEAGVRRARRVSAARLTDVLAVDSNPQQTNHGSLDLTQEPVSHETQVGDPLSVIIENDIQMTDDDVNLIKEEPIHTFVIDDDSDDDSPLHINRAPQFCVIAPTATNNAPQFCAIAPTATNNAPQFCAIAPTATNIAPQRVYGKAPQRGTAPPPLLGKAPQPLLDKAPLRANNIVSMGNKGTQKSNVLPDWASGLSTAMAGQPGTAQYAIQTNADASAGGGQMLALQCAQTGNFVLHQILMGSDGIQYVPTIPARIVNGTLEPISLSDARHLAVITDAVTVPPPATVRQLPPPAPVLKEVPPAPRNLRNVSNDDVLGVTITIEPDDGPSPGPPPGSTPGPRLPRQGLRGPVRRAPVEVDSPPPGPRDPPPGPRDPPPGPRVPWQGPRGPGQRAPVEEPPPKKSSIDWEDKIPMDVISYMDATDPQAASNTFPHPAAQAPLGIISNVYSEAETAAAAHSIENECIF